jgi:hypothetical protein
MGGLGKFLGKFAPRAMFHAALQKQKTRRSWRVFHAANS